MEFAETKTATVERVNSDLVIFRYKHGVRVDAIAVCDKLDERLRFPSTESCAVIGVFPQDVDSDMTTLEKNHYTDMALNEVIQVLVIVAEGTLFDQMAL